MKLRKHLLFLFLLSITLNNAIAQSSTLDSLKQILTSALDDYIRAKTSFDLGFYYLDVDADSSRKYLQTTIKYARKVNDEFIIADAYRHLSTSYINAGLYDSALQSSINAHQLYRELGDKSGEAGSLNLFAIIFMNKGEYDTANYFLNKSLEITTKNEDLEGQASAYNVLGNIAQRQGKYPQASDFLHESLAIHKELGNKEGLADALNNIGVIYEYLERYDDALKNYNEFYQVYKQSGNKLGVAIGLHNAGIILKKTNRLDSAIVNFKQALVLDKSINSIDGIAYDLKELGETYFLMGNLDTAYRYFHKSLYFSQSFHDPVVIVPALIGIGNIHKKNTKFDSARFYLEEALQKAKNSSLKNEEKIAAQSLYQLFNSIGDVETAFQHYLMYTRLKDELFSEENIRQLAIIEAEHEFEQLQKDQEIQSKLIELEKDQEVSRALRVRDTSIVALVLITIMAFLLFKNFQRKKEANEKLNHLVGKLEAAHLEIKLMNNSLEDKILERTNLLEEKNEKLEKYMYSNSHLVRAPLARILALVQHYKSGEEKDLDFINNNIYLSAQELDKVIRELNDILSNDGN